MMLVMKRLLELGGRRSCYGAWRVYLLLRWYFMAVLVLHEWQGCTVGGRGVVRRWFEHGRADLGSLVLLLVVEVLRAGVEQGEEVAVAGCARDLLKEGLAAAWRSTSHHPREARVTAFPGCRREQGVHRFVGGAWWHRLAALWRLLVSLEREEGEGASFADDALLGSCGRHHDALPMSRVLIGVVLLQDKVPQALPRAYMPKLGQRIPP